MEAWKPTATVPCSLTSGSAADPIAVLDCCSAVMKHCRALPTEGRKCRNLLVLGMRRFLRTCLSQKKQERIEVRR